MFEILQQDITKLSLEGNIAIIGDLNAHINISESKYITNEKDDSLDDFLPINDIADAVLKSRSTEISHNTNIYGKQLIELCISAPLRILNRRKITYPKKANNTVCSINKNTHSQHDKNKQNTTERQEKERRKGLYTDEIATQQKLNRTTKKYTCRAQLSV
ncbi:unnamed protein product [Mytilus edulis]|uniref:Endonuclease/exonuclease/phosphatase domain-containing protein n=1 Tax=Mytilus edulis TaxID=6550 RepID=A0A8S3SZU4_MYTED|nr:unnamed protein product [Mytilus edulis]